MRNLPGITLLFLLVSCGTTQKSVPTYIENKVIPIRIVFLVDKESFNYKFKFLNRSQDTLEIVKPQPYFSYSHFKRITADSTISNTSCIMANLRSVAWIELPPNKEITIDGAVGLKEYFCQFNEDDLLAFSHIGSYARKNGSGGHLCFEIQPVPFKEIDSVVIDKILF